LNFVSQARHVAGLFYFQFAGDTMNKLLEDLARAVGKALAKKWMSDLRQRQVADDPKRIPGSKRATGKVENRLENPKD
jgi:hypothetical protein